MGSVGTLKQFLTGNGTVGLSHVGDDVDNVLKLYSAVSIAGNWTSFRLYNGSAAYQVPALKKLEIFGAMGWNGGTTQSGIDIFYADTSVTNGAAPTNPVTVGGFTGTSGDGRFFVQASNATVLSYGQIVPFFLSVPANKYPVLYAPSNGIGAWIFATLEDA